MVISHMDVEILLSLVQSTTLGTLDLVRRSLGGERALLGLRL